MPGLLSLSLDLPTADLVRIVQDLHPILSAHGAWLTQKFPNGATFVPGALAQVERFAQLADTATIESADRAREESEQALLQAKIRGYVSTARRRARRVCDAIKTVDLPTARALSTCIGLNSRLSVTRTSELNQLLFKTAAAHTEFHDLLVSWGSSDAFLDEAQTLCDALGPQTAELRKEQAEAESANAALAALASIVVFQTNDLIEAVEEFAPDEDAELFQKTASVLNKYNYLLSSRRDDAAAAGDEAEDDNS